MAQPPTVMQIIPDLDTGGAERTAVDVAAALVAAGGRALVAARGGRLVEELTATGATFLPFPAATKNPFRILWNGLRLARLVRREGVDILHARSRAPAWSALIAARLAKVPLVTTYHGAYRQSGRLKGLYNSVMARGDAVIANSGYTARLIAERHGIAGDRVTVIHRGTDMRAYASQSISPQRTQALGAEWGLTDNRAVILQLARVTEWKGQRVLIEALRLLASEGRRDWVAVLAGDAQGRDGYLASLRAAITDAGLEDSIRLPGHCADPAAAMALCDVAVVPSTEPEAFGRAAVEAQAFGRPVIVSDLGAVPETVLTPPEAGESERTGWRVPAGDATALAAALGRVLALDTGEREAIGARARRHVETSFSLDLMTGATLAVYARLVSPKTTGNH